jgi:hypothetical protein
MTLITRQAIETIIANVENNTEWIEARVRRRVWQEPDTRPHRAAARIEQPGDFAEIDPWRKTDRIRD